MKWATALLMCLLLASPGCSRAKYAARADADAKKLVAEKACENNWATKDLEVRPDPRSRYHDIYSEIRPPIPQDDPQSHRYMRRVDGYKGYKHWYDDGAREFLDNPAWTDELASYCEITEQGAVRLSLPAAINIARVNSPDIQRQIETVYLSALDVSAERFEFDVQYFAGNDTTWSHFGRLRNPALGERNELITNTDALLRKRFTSAGELLVGFANTFVWQFAGPDSNNTFSLLNFALVQPLLRGAFRGIALEDLTQAERNLLANLRALERYYQGFLTNLAVGQLGVLGPIRTPSDPDSFTGDVDSSIRLETLASQQERQSVVSPNRALTTGFVTAIGARLDGFLGLQQQLQEIRNSEQNLAAQERAVRLLEAHLAAGNIELIQVDEFRQNVEVERTNLLELQTRFENAVDNYKVTRLGMPPDLEVVIDDSLIRPVNLNSEQVLNLQRQSQSLLSQARDLIDGKDVDSKQLQAMMADQLEGSDRLANELDSMLERPSKQGETFEMLPTPNGDDGRPVRITPETPEPEVPEPELPDPELPDPEEASAIDELVPPAMSDPSGEQPIAGGKLSTPADALIRIKKRIEALRIEMPPLEEELSASELARMSRGLAEIADLLYLTEIRVRLAKVSLSSIGLNSQEAIGIASLNRLDWMNARASVVDQWRQITIQANSLRSDMDVFVSGDIGTVGNNPVRFRGPTGTLRLGVRFDGALTRLLERNAFRESIIEYERSRRDLIQFQDTVGQNLRRVLREMAQLERTFEIQRKAVEIAVRRVDVSLQLMNRPPVPAPVGGPNNQLSPTTSFNMLTALGDLRASKDNVLSVWLNYQSARLLLARDLGVMGMDSDNIWLEALGTYYPDGIPCELDPVPPKVIFEELPPGAILDGGVMLEQGMLPEWQMPNSAPASLTVPSSLTNSANDSQGLATGQRTGDPTADAAEPTKDGPARDGYRALQLGDDAPSLDASFSEPPTSDADALMSPVPAPPSARPPSE